MKFNYDDAGRVYRSFLVELVQDEEVIGSLMFEDNNVHHNWQYGTYMTDEGMGNAYNLIGLENLSMRVTVAKTNESDDGGPDIIEEQVYEQPVSFTIGEQSGVYGAYIPDNNLMYGSYYFSYVPVYSGYLGNYTCQLRLECSSGTIYTCNAALSMKGDRVEVYLTNAFEGFNEETFEEDFDGPTKITLIVSIYGYEDTGDSTASNSELVLMDEYEIVLYESYQFMLSA